MKNSKAGFSLIEIAMTAMLIAIAAVTALSYIVYCDRLALHADARITAANFARETIEGLYKRDYRDTRLNLSADPGVSDSLPTGTAFGHEFYDRYPGATRRHTIIDKTDYKLITVKVTWNQ